VCTLYDEGAPPGEGWALKNVSGEHYRPLFESEAFYRATSFEELTTGIDRGLSQPDELHEERDRIVRLVLGEIDGRAAERVAEAIVTSVDDNPASRSRPGRSRWPRRSPRSRPPSPSS
jgi:hypothetical protein